jgi:hypothetical protein
MLRIRAVFDAGLVGGAVAGAVAGGIQFFHPRAWRAVFLSGLVGA